LPQYIGESKMFVLIRNILLWTLKKYGEAVRNCFLWLRIRTLLAECSYFIMFRYILIFYLSRSVPNLNFYSECIWNT